MDCSVKARFMGYLTEQKHQDYHISLNGKFLMSASKAVLSSASPFFRSIIEQVPGAPPCVDFVGDCSAAELWSSIQLLYMQVVYPPSPDYLTTLPPTAQALVGFFKTVPCFQDEDIFNPTVLPSKQPFKLKLNKVSTIPALTFPQNPAISDPPVGEADISDLHVGEPDVSDPNIGDPDSVSPAVFTCTICSKAYRKAKHLGEHIRKKHVMEQTRPVYSCGQCQKKYKDKRSAERCSCQSSRSKKKGEVGVEFVKKSCYQQVFVMEEAGDFNDIARDVDTVVTSVTGESDSLELMNG
eukprot:GFUD01041526.1.p1 GENE.GFUD01041526.1~~GFUD01041526.1.p1  ORF type:complete len:348 (+),score=72.67 GFUD01041526.1:157-1044(+)